MKTKYEQLCEKFMEAEKKHRNQRKACFIFAKSFLLELQEFFGCSTEAFSLMKAKPEHPGEKELSSREIEVMEEAPDGFWKFNFQFQLQLPSHVFALGWLFFWGLVRQTDSGFTLRWGTKQYSFTSNLKECEEFLPFCDAFLEDTTNYLTDPMLLHPKDMSIEGKTGRIEFQPGLESPEKSQH